MTDQPMFKIGDTVWRPKRVSTMVPCDYCDDGLVEIHHRGLVDSAKCPKCDGRVRVSSYSQAPTKEKICGYEVMVSDMHGGNQSISYTFEYRGDEHYYGPLFVTQEECQQFIDGE